MMKKISIVPAYKNWCCFNDN